jgi:hypothetical protein
MTIFTRIADAQALVLGVVLLWAGLWKVVSPQARELAKKSALAKLLPTSGMAQAAHIAVGASEILVAALLLLPPHLSWEPYLASALAVGFLAYLALAWKVAPEKTCACMGGRPTRISKRSVARAGAILLLTLLAWPAQMYWGAALVASPWLGIVIVLELLGLWALSPEFGGPEAAFQRRFVRLALLRLNPTCAGVALDWERVESDLRRTSQFNALARYTRGIADRWREDCAGFIAYKAVYEGQPATAIFTFPVRFEASEVTAALLDDASNEVLTRLAPPTLNHK